MNGSVFYSAIKGSNGEVDPGYLAMFWALVGWSISGAVILLAGAISVYKDAARAAEIIQAIGVGCAAVSGGFAAVLGAVGLFRAGDKPRVNTVTTSAQQTSVTQTPAQ